MNEATAVVVREPDSIELGTLRADTPTALIEAARAIATPLAKLINDRELYSRIQGRDYVKVEGWTTMGAMLGVIPQEVSSACDENGVYVSTVELVNIRTGAIVGRASAECGNPDEVDKNGKPLWASRAAYARRSMAATRATGKAFRLSFSWIMTLAGYMPTPAEEMMINAEPDHKARPGGDSVADDGTPIWRGKIISYDPIEGVNKGVPWKLHKFKCHDGTEFGTFHDTIKDAMKALVGSMAEIEWEPAPKGGKNILRCAPLR